MVSNFQADLCLMQVRNHTWKLRKYIFLYQLYVSINKILPWRMININMDRGSENSNDLDNFCFNLIKNIGESSADNIFNILTQEPLPVIVKGLNS